MESFVVAVVVCVVVKAVVVFAIVVVVVINFGPKNLILKFDQNQGSDS